MFDLSWHMDSLIRGMCITGHPWMGVFQADSTIEWLSKHKWMDIAAKKLQKSKGK